jgi:hypothetical protein
MNNDTVSLLKECNSGIKMGENAISKVLPRVHSEELRHTLQVCKNTHAELGDKTHGLLISYNADTKPPHPVARLMSDLKISMKLMEGGDDKIADVIEALEASGVKSYENELFGSSTPFLFAYFNLF